MAGKLLTFPLAILTIIALIGMIGGQTINSGTWSTTNGTQTITGTQFAITSTITLITFLSLLILVGIGSGISVFGSGLKDTSVLIVFKACGFMGMWIVLTIIGSATFAGAGTIGTTSYIGLTMMYVVGFILHIRGGTDG